MMAGIDSSLPSLVTLRVTVAHIYATECHLHLGEVLKSQHFMH